MNHLFTIFFIFNCAFSFSQDSIKKKEKKNSIGVFASPAEFTFWTYNMSANQEWSSDPKRLNASPFKPLGLAYQYKLNYLLKLQCEVAYDKEQFLYSAIVGEENMYINYNVEYLKVPIGIRFYPSHIYNEEAFGGFFLQLSGSFDFVTKEDIQKETSLFVDPRFPQPPGGIPASPVTTTETHSNQLRLHKICPALSLGYEIARNNFSFFYEGRLEMQSVYQNRNIQEYFRNRNFSLLILGFSYRF